MSVNYDDKRFQNVEKQEKNELKEVNKTYDNMINQSKTYYDNLIKESNNYAKEQKKLQQQQTDFTIEQINQNKDWAEKDYTREQKGAYADWRKQSNEYGAESELMASKGLTNTGYSESSQVSMYNTYQNRVATARDSYNRAVQDYDNQITQARLANSSALAEIAHNALKEKLELSLQGFQYNNTLLDRKLTAQQSTKDRYYSRWQDVLKQINTENALAEQKREFDEQMNYTKNQSSNRAYISSGGGGSYSGGNLTITKDNSTTTNNSSNGGGSSNNKSTYSPNLTNSGRDWYVKSALNTTKPVSETTIVNTLTSAYNSGQISQGDVQNILKAFGLS